MSPISRDDSSEQTTNFINKFYMENGTQKKKVLLQLILLFIDLKIIFLQDGKHKLLKTI